MKPDTKAGLLLVKNSEMSGSYWLLCRAYFWFLDLEDARRFEGSAERALGMFPCG